jgi:hypothetical protein
MPSLLRGGDEEVTPAASARGREPCAAYFFHQLALPLEALPGPLNRRSRRLPSHEPWGEVHSGLAPGLPKRAHKGQHCFVIDRLFRIATSN